MMRTDTQARRQPTSIAGQLAIRIKSAEDTIRSMRSKMRGQLVIIGHQRGTIKAQAAEITALKARLSAVVGSDGERP